MLAIVIVALICAIIIIYLKNINNDLTILALIMSGIIIVSISFEYLYNSFDMIRKIINLSGIDSQLYSIMFKIVAIGFLIEFGAGVIDDFGLKSLADKLIFVGKVIILFVALPIIYAVFNLFYNFLQ